MPMMRYQSSLIFILSIMISLVPISDVYSDDTLDIDDETIALQQVYAIFGSDSERFKRQKLDMLPLQDATMTVMNIRTNWEKWSPGFRKIAEGYFVKKQLSPVESHLRRAAGL